MENSYGIGVRNRYELFYNEDVDPMEILKKREKTKVKAAEKENKGKTAKPKDPVKKAAKTEPAPKTTNKTSATGNQQKGPRTNDGRTNANEGRTNANSGGPNANDGMNASDGRVKLSDREERNNRRNRPEGEFRDGPPPRFDGEGRGMGRGRGRGMGRGRGRGRGGPGGDSRGKREFDRQSGMVTTGVKSVDKREGSGSYNWGSDKDQIEEQLNDAPNANSDHDSSTENVEKPADDTGATPEGEETKEEEVVREMTLDEWKAMQGARTKPTFNIRRAGEGENQAQWKKTYVLKKKETENVEVESEGAESEEEVHHGRRKVVLDIDFQFADSPSRGRGRGRGRGGIGRGRGGDRMERGGRGGGRGERRGGPSARGRGVPQQEAPKMDDERDFPSLG